MELFGAGGVPADVVGGPQRRELRAAGGQLADQRVQVAVVGAAADFGSQLRDGVAGGFAPVRVHIGRSRVEEDEAAVVRYAGAFVDTGAVIQVAVQRTGQAVGRQHVEPAV